MATRAKELSDLGNLKLDVTANGIDVVGVGSNFKSESYNILNLQTDTDDSGSSDDGIFKITNGAAGTTKAEFRWDESEDLVHVSYGDHGRHISINSSGNVGIGTASTDPDTLLHLHSSAGNTILTIEADSDNNDETDAPQIHFLTDGGLRTAAITGGNATSDDSAVNANALNLQSQTIRFLTSSTQDFDTATEKMVIDSSGKVGIGTSSLGTSKLTVYNSTVAGNTRLHVHNDKVGDAAELRLEGKRTSSNDTGQLLYVNSGNVVARIDAVSGGDDGELRFFTSLTGTGDNIVERVSISQAGDVRIQGGQLALSNLASDPASPISGAMYFNTASDLAYVYNGSSWDQISNVPFGATGGTETTYSADGKNYKVHTFLTSGTFTPLGSGTVDVLVVAGGGGGGNCNTSEQGGGGGGAGGFITSSGTSGANSSAITPIVVQPQAYTVTVGAGGAAGSFAEDQPGSQGGNSSFATVTAIGGGGGGGNSTEGQSGGSGGGGKESNGVGRSGTAGQGFSGGSGSEADDRGGGGGGAGQAGQNYNAAARSDGGDGLANSLRTGSPVSYAGGGAGGGTRLGVASGGTGGGGNAGVAGAANTGGGGGSDTGTTAGTAAKAGGSGIVVIRYEVQ